MERDARGSERATSETRVKRWSAADVQAKTGSQFTSPLGHSFATLLTLFSPIMPLQPATPTPAALDELLQKLDLERDDRVVILNFFRSDCPWCASELPQIADVYRRHEKLDFLLVGIAVGNDSEEDAINFANAKNLDFPTTADSDGAVRSAFAIERVPAFVVINPHGLVERTYAGVTEQLAGILEQTILAVAHDNTPPTYDMIGNGCAP